MTDPKRKSADREAAAYALADLVVKEWQSIKMMFDRGNGALYQQKLAKLEAAKVAYENS